MHPQLSDKRLVCREFIQALEQCHADFWSRFTGSCNGAKNDLNMCLRKERLQRAAKNRDDAKGRQERKEEAWRDLHRDD